MMIIIGVDFHPEFQQIASVDTDTGELQEKRLAHREEAENLSPDLKRLRASLRLEKQHLQRERNGALF